jgi:hypothetical protein
MEVINYVLNQEQHKIRLELVDTLILYSNLKFYLYLNLFYVL